VGGKSLEEQKKRIPEARGRDHRDHRGLHLWTAKINFPRGATLLEKIEPAKSKVVQYLATVGGWDGGSTLP
jgi:hypothetical protein